MFDVYKWSQYVIMYVSEKKILDKVINNVYLENSSLII